MEDVRRVVRSYVYDSEPANDQEFYGYPLGWAFRSETDVIAPPTSTKAKARVLLPLVERMDEAFKTAKNELAKGTNANCKTDSKTGRKRYVCRESGKPIDHTEYEARYRAFVFPNCSTSLISVSKKYELLVMEEQRKLDRAFEQALSTYQANVRALERARTVELSSARENADSKNAQPRETNKRERAAAESRRRRTTRRVGLDPENRRVSIETGDLLESFRRDNL